MAEKDFNETTNTSSGALTAIKYSTIKPGLQLFPKSAKNRTLYEAKADRLNYYATITEFYRNALWGQYPDVPGASVDLLRSLELSYVDRSLHGFGAVLKSGGNYHPVNSRYLWPLLDDQEIKIGWVIGFPYSSGRDDAIMKNVDVPSLNTRSSYVKDRIILIVKEDAAQFGLRMTHEFSGSTLGRRIATEGVDASCIVYGDGIDDYTRVIYLINELENRLNKNSKILDRHSNPHIQGPASAAPKIVVDAEGNKQTRGFQFNEDGMYLPNDKDEPPYEYLTWDSGQTLNGLHTDRIIDLIHVLTGIPPMILHLTHTSGISMERQMFAALSKVRRHRREIETGVKQYNPALDFTWVADPFESEGERVDRELKLLEAGVIDADETRKRLYIPGKAPVIEPPMITMNPEQPEV